MRGREGRENGEGEKGMQTCSIDKLDLERVLGGSEEWPVNARKAYVMCKAGKLLILLRRWFLLHDFLKRLIEGLFYRLSSFHLVIFIIAVVTPAFVIIATRTIFWSFLHRSEWHLDCFAHLDLGRICSRGMVNHRVPSEEGVKRKTEVGVVT